MLRFTTALTILATLLTLSPSQARTLQQAKASGTLLIANSMDTTNFYFLDANKQPSGFEVEVGQAVAKELGLTAKFVVVQWSGLLQELNAHPEKIDVVIASHTITSTRMKQVEFSIPHYCTGGVIITRAGGPLTSKELNGHRVAVEGNSTFEGFVRKHPNHLIPQVVNDTTQAVIDRKATIGITDYFYVLQAIKENPKQKLVMGPLLWKEQIGMAFAKGNTPLRDAVNTALRKLMADGTYDKISQKWFGRSVRCQN